MLLQTVFKKRIYSVFPKLISNWQVFQKIKIKIFEGLLYMYAQNLL